jgi:hypothetical protein
VLALLQFRRELLLRHSLLRISHLLSLDNNPDWNPNVVCRAAEDGSANPNP